MPAFCGEDNRQSAPALHPQRLPQCRKTTRDQKNTREEKKAGHSLCGEKEHTTLNVCYSLSLSLRPPPKYDGKHATNHHRQLQYSRMGPRARKIQQGTGALFSGGLEIGINKSCSAAGATLNPTFLLEVYTSPMLSYRS